ncbi:hypothetical protein [Crocosphaera sp. XPORK-15E]|nr:hypothetical protein [Crocosphaera sp. XPORK-15E]MEA5534098.1 hypothetical protein [Crocosphaera sp. XPORK-15E]
MTITRTPSSTNTSPKEEIIFPQGEFWSDEPQNDMMLLDTFNQQ